MKLKTYSSILLLITILGCQSYKPNRGITYELVKDDDDIFVEKFDSTNVDENRYNKNNRIYKTGTSFTYDFEHLIPTGEKQYFKISNDRKDWVFVESDALDPLIVKSVTIQVMDGNPMAQYVPDYNQTTIAYKLIEGLPFTMSGVIENEANIWIHPPREHYFKILELNPFPYIKAPYEIGTEWTWSLNIGNIWADERWKVWEGNIKNSYHYKITDRVILQTALGPLDCFVIESSAKSSIGNTALKAFFNETYGFVKLNYTNIDGSRTNLILSQHLTNKKD